MKSLVGLLVALLVGGAGCAPDPGGARSSAVAAIDTPTITTDAASYIPGQHVLVNVTGMPGNAHDWVSIAPFGSSADTAPEWTYTRGAVDLMTGFIAPHTSGSYVVRAFLDDSYTELAESAVFIVANPDVATVTTDRAAYTFGQPIRVTWSGLPGNFTDRIVIAMAGSPPNQFVQSVPSQGVQYGNLRLNPPGPGNFVARVFVSGSTTPLGESAVFTVAGPSHFGLIAIDSTRYPWGGRVIATLSDFPGGPRDWIAIAPAGAPDSVTGQWFYMHGTSGTQAFDLPAEDLPTTPAAFIIHAFTDDSYVLIGESARFSLTGTIMTSAATYRAGDAIGVATSGLPTNPTRIAIATPGSPGASIVLLGQAGDPAFPQGLDAPGTYVVRVLGATSDKIYAESAPFAITDRVLVNAPCTTSCVPAGSPVQLHITFHGLPGGATDWISIAPLGSSDTTATTWGYTGAQVNGSVDLNTPAAPGTYVARAYINDSYTKIAESASFVLQ